MFRKTIATLAAGLAALLVTGVAQARDQIQIVGSSTVYPFTTVVAERHGSKGFKTPVVESTGTGGGMKLFCGGVGTGHPDMTNASRAIKDSEKEICKKNGVSEVVEIIVGNDGIAFANSVKGPQFDLTLEQIWKAMAEKGPKPSRWNEIDPSLPNAEIEILVPPPTSGTRDAWNSLAMGGGCDPAVKKANKDDCELMREDGRVTEGTENDTLLVQKLDKNPNAFAIFGFSYLDSNRDKIQPAVIDGLEPTLEGIQSYEYAISRPLFFYVKKQHMGVIPGMQDFIEEYTSNAAMGPFGYLSDIGLVPLSPKQRREIQKNSQEMVTISM